MGAYAGPELADDGLVLALDAANTRSYGGSGTTWTDISYRGNNGTLTNGPAYTTVGFNEPFGGAGGVYFDGTGDYLQIGQNSAFDLSGDFTSEFWTYPLDNYTSAYTLYIGTPSGSGDYFGLKFGQYVAQFAGSGEMFWTGLPPLGSWTHLALVRSGSTVTLYQNGVSLGTATKSSTWIGSSQNVQIGAAYSANNVNAYISNLRIIKGTALYTSNFTPPRSLLTAVSGTSLLTCQKGSIRDASSNNFAITVNGDARPVYGFPSFKFDGTNDGVTIGSFPNTTFDFGSGEFTLECWVNISTFAAGGATTYGINMIYATGDGDVGSDFRFFITQGSTLGGYTTNGVYLSVNSTPIAIGAYSSFATNTWYYVSASRIGNSLYLFLNGALLSTTSYALSISNATSYQPSIGAIQYRGSFLYPLNGRISNFRVLKGKGLTASEVLKNYQNTKSRYGL
jgi:hypothetical protein